MELKMYDIVMYEGKECIMVNPYYSGESCIVELNENHGRNGWTRGGANKHLVPDNYTHKLDRFWSVSACFLTLVHSSENYPIWN